MESRRSRPAHRHQPESGHPRSSSHGGQARRRGFSPRDSARSASHSPGSLRLGYHPNDEEKARMAKLAGQRIDYKSVRLNLRTGATTGGTAKVIRGVWRDQWNWYRWDVAVKQIEVSTTENQKEPIRHSLKLLLREVEFMRACSSIHVMKALGWYTDCTKTFWVVLPWMRISMKQFLDQGKLTLPERISLIRDVADGVDHLHTRPKPIVHSDLKSVNIMISSSNRAVITDFGAAHYQRDSQPEASRRSNQNLQVRSSSSTTVSEAEYSSSENIIFITGDQWTLRWAAPEVLEGGEDSIGCLPRDVWSLAWVAYEAFTGKVPFEEERRDFVVVGKIVQIRLPFVPKEEESKMIQQLLDFMVKCWSRDMASRPSANAFMKEAARLNPIVPVHNRNDPKIHLREGELWASDRKYDQAVESYKKAAKLYESNAMIEGHANVAHKLATVYKVLRKWHNAREWFKKGETLYRSLQDNIGVAFLLLGWASSEKDSGDIPGAISKYKTALNLFMLESDGRYGLGYTYVRLGSAHVTQGDSIRAHRAYDAALNVFEGLDDQRMVSHCNVGIGRLYLSDSRNEPADVNKRELLDKSINCFKAALNADEMLGIDDPRGQAAVLKGAGHVSFAQGNNSRAINYWKRAQATYRAVGDQRECDSLEERIRSLQRP